MKIINLSFPTNILKGLFCIQNTLLSMVALQKPPKPPTLLRRAAKSFLEDHHANIYLIGYPKNRPFIIHQMKYLIYNFSTYNALSILHIDWNHKGMGRRKAQYTFLFLYAHYAYTPINYMKIEIILFYSVQIYRILYN